ncbi:uncharacterized protein TRUGW13939_01387 [Talaromyces rugulosus]|uniref:BZIP domain-containing protein n=1 Tax=Talaromyces rugulosus TaxID=121627 RepID=A0A7H8QLC1_TALRU|nr:uncharacterized protein TRUGW13939_01387 [Talaromyces rugulosus]QKX54301.1 hypothetical protein TRUGW13939_01387 [Talaromyces rugulosus]
MRMSFGLTGPERRREQNRLAQRRFRQRHDSQQRSSESRPRVSISSLGVPSHRETDHKDIVRPESTVSLLRNNNTDLSDGAPYCEFSWLNEDTVIDGINFENDFGRSGLESLQAPNTWISQPKEDFSQTVDPILKSFSHGAPHTSFYTISNDTRTVDFVSSGASPLHTAAKRGHVKIVRLLLEHDAYCNVQDDDGATPLMHATIGGHEEAASLLLSHGASIQCVDYHNRSALHWAVICRHVHLLRMLLNHCIGDKSVIDGITRDGGTPLHIAVETNFEAAVEALLNSGADTQHKARNNGIVRICS